jgi:hypothetical protein
MLRKPYVRAVEAFNRRIGRIAMYLLFALMGVMLFGALSRAAWVPQSWTDEMAQFLMVGYFMLGGAWAIAAWGRRCGWTCCIPHGRTAPAGGGGCRDHPVLMFYLGCPAVGRDRKPAIRAGIRESGGAAVAALHGAGQDHDGAGHRDDAAAMHGLLHPRRRALRGRII